MRDLQDLISRAEAIVDYYHRFGMLRWDRMGFDDLKHAPTTQVVGVTDYVATLGDLHNAIGFLAINPRGGDQYVESLQSCLERIERIFLANIGASDLLVNLGSTVESLEYDLKQVESYDEFYFELACRCRELAEHYITVIRRYFGHSSETSALGLVELKISELDKIMKLLQEKFAQLVPHPERPFPARACYAPDSYWWYLT
jgi:hypothetical protein